MMIKVIFDTNFLLIPATRGVDIFSELERIMDVPYEICILRGTLDELGKIADEQKGKHKNAAQMALNLIRAKKPVVLEDKQKDLKRTLNSNDLIVDDIILEIADNETVVATQDKELKKRLSEKGINFIYLKNRKLIKNVL